MIPTSDQHATVVEAVTFRTAHPYGPGPACANFDEAVAEARSQITTFDYGHVQRGSRAFVEMRCRYRYLPAVDQSAGGDERLMLWEVFRDCVVPVPAGQSGLTDAQHDALKAQGLVEHDRAGR